MSDFSPDDFEKILDIIKHKIGKFLECGYIRAIESNFNTKGMEFKKRDSDIEDGIIIVG